MWQVCPENNSLGTEQRRGLIVRQMQQSTSLGVLEISNVWATVQGCNDSCLVVSYPEEGGAAPLY
jgi:hypothetical protein